MRLNGRGRVDLRRRVTVSPSLTRPQVHDLVGLCETQMLDNAKELEWLIANWDTRTQHWKLLEHLATKEDVTRSSSIVLGENN